MKSRFNAEAQRTQRFAGQIEIVFSALLRVLRASAFVPFSV